MSYPRAVDLDGAFLSVSVALFMIPAGLFIVFFLLVLVFPDVFWTVAPYTSLVGFLLVPIGISVWVFRLKRVWIWVIILGFALLITPLIAEIAVRKVQTANAIHGYIVQHEPFPTA